MILFLFILLSFNLFAQNSSNIELFPLGRSLPSLRGNMKEGRVGVLYFIKDAHLKVDVGNSVDIIKYIDGNYLISAGIDFSAFAYSTNNEKLRLQIDALDGLFGGNLTFIYYDKLKDGTLNSNCLQKESKYFARFRFMHNSAHLVDGNWWMHSYPRDWLKEGGPIPFTRDFAELFAGMIKQKNNLYFKLFAGIEYTTHFRPEEQKRVLGDFGSEIYYSLNSFIYDKNVNIFCSYFGVLNGVSRYILNNHLQTGIKIGNPEDKGLVLYFSFYSGNNYFSEYYVERMERLGIGFEVDF